MTAPALLTRENDAYSPQSAPPLPRLARLGDLLTEFEADAAALYAARTSGQPRGPQTGLPRLDQELGGALQPGLHTIHAGSGVGKTALALQIAATCGFPAIFLSCEMSLLELLRRHTARATGTFLGRLKSGELPPAEAVALARQAAATAPQLVLADATQSFAPPAWIRAAAQSVRGDANHLLIVVDSLHSWAEAAPGGVTEYEALNLAIAALRALAHELRCPILCIAERNRASMNSGGISAGAGSRKIEYAGETVMELNCDPDAAPDPNGEVAVTLRLVKNRHGSMGKKLPLKFHGALQRFREADR